MEVTEYEEVWREIPPISGPNRAWILESTSEGRNTFLGRISGGYMALGDKKVSSFGARSEEWDEREGRWKVNYAIGDVDNIPSIADLGANGFSGEAEWQVGNTVIVMGGKYLVRAFESLK
jgi:hypothetical protein